MDSTKKNMIVFSGHLDRVLAAFIMAKGGQGSKMAAMSMDVMGIRAGELLEGLDNAGVTTDPGEAGEAILNLLIRPNGQAGYVKAAW